MVLQVKQPKVVSFKPLPIALKEMEPVFTDFAKFMSCDVQVQVQANEGSGDVEDLVPVGSGIHVQGPIDEGGGAVLVLVCEEDDIQDLFAEEGDVNTRLHGDEGGGVIEVPEEADKSEVNKGGDDERVQDDTEDRGDRDLHNNFEEETFGGESTVKDVDILDNRKEMARKVPDNVDGEDRSFEVPAKETLDADLKEVTEATNEPEATVVPVDEAPVKTLIDVEEITEAHSEETPTPVDSSEAKPTKKPVDFCPSSQGGLGEEGALVGTTTPSGPSSPRGSGVPVRIPQTLKPKLTIRMSLSFHAKVFDPLGLVLPTRMIGMLLFRTSLQEMKKELKGRIPWDEHLVGDLLAQWLRYFEKLLRLDKIKFKRSFKLETLTSAIKQPSLMTIKMLLVQ